MTDLQRIQLRQSELRSQIQAELAKEVETRSHEDLERMTREMQGVEIELRAAMVADEASSIPDKVETPEARELNNIHKRASIGNFIESATKDTQLDGAELELRDHFLGKGASHGQVPIEMLLPAGELVVDDIEQRADSVTPVADSVIKTGSQSSILMRVFTRSIAARMQVAMPSVPVGAANYPVLTGGTGAEMKRPDAVMDAEPASFEGFTLEPTRLHARYLFRIEDTARLQGYENALRSDIRAVLSDEMDNQIINGNGTSPNVSGFLHELPAAAVATAVTDWNAYLTLFTSMVDGLNAYNLSDITSIMGSHSFQYLSTLFRTGAADNGPRDSALDYVAAKVGAQSVSSRVPTITNGQVNLAALTSYPGRNAVAPVWRGFDLLRDPYTAANRGQVVLNAIMLWNFKIVRETGFKLWTLTTST